ncbi:MAG: thioredoxin family protein [Fuerstiella sp.]|nr:thioredoxin family protein [Fuerstiella sp.]
MRRSSNTLKLTSENTEGTAKQITEQSASHCGRSMRAVLTVALVASAVVPSTAMADHVTWSPDVESALRTANDGNRLVLMKFTADWCGPCKRYERETFSRPVIAEFVNQNFVPVLVDIDKRKELAKQLKVDRVPAVLIVSPEMVILSRTTGFQSEQKLLPNLKRILATHTTAKPSSSANIAAVTKFSASPTLPVSRQTASSDVSEAALGIVPVPPAPAMKAAFGGLCLSAVQETRTLVSGMPELALHYRDKLLYFSSVEQMQNFQKKPQKYWPQGDGVCPVTLAETGKAVEGQLKYAAIFRKKLWLLNNAENMKKFVSEPGRYADRLPPASTNR